MSFNDRFRLFLNCFGSLPHHPVIILNLVDLAGLELLFDLFVFPFVGDVVKGRDILRVEPSVEPDELHVEKHGEDVEAGLHPEKRLRYC